MDLRTSVRLMRSQMRQLAGYADREAGVAYSTTSGGLGGMLGAGEGWGAGRWYLIADNAEQGALRLRVRSHGRRSPTSPVPHPQCVTEAS